MLTKKQIKKIKNGNHSVLMDCLDYLLDTYEENKWDLGYNACISDFDVYAHRLAELLTQEVELRGKAAKHNGESYFLLDEKEVEQIINDFFKDIINDKK
jgi:hypothetical protein